MTARELYEQCVEVEGYDPFPEYDFCQMKEMLKKYANSDGFNMTHEAKRLVGSLHGPNYVLCRLGLDDHKAICGYNDTGCDECQFSGEDGCGRRVAQYLLSLFPQKDRGDIECLL